MRVTIDPELCQGHLRCFAVAPDLFEVDHIGHALAPDREISREEFDLARSAASSCPERAIRIEE